MLHVLCFGNQLHGDDGIGPRIASNLLGETLPAQTKVFDCGIAGLNALPFFTDCDHVLMIDACDLGDSAGSWRYIDVNELARQEVNTEDHGGGLSYLLNAVQAIIDPCPVLGLIGVQIESVKSFHPELSPCVENAVDTVTKEVLRVAHCWPHAVNDHE